jgi:hypothetical protein
MDLEYKVSDERFTKVIAVGDDEKYFNATGFMQVLESYCIEVGTPVTMTIDRRIIMDRVEAVCNHTRLALSSELY